VGQLLDLGWFEADAEPRGAIGEQIQCHRLQASTFMVRARPTCDRCRRSMVRMRGHASIL
jgi:hypothetical protein